MDRTDRYVISGRVVAVRITDDEWVMRVGRTAYAVAIGLMLLVPAIVLFLWGGGVIEIGGAARRPPIFWTLVLGVPFFWLGLYGSLGRRGLLIDRRRATVRRWWGVLGPLITRTHDLSPAVRVVLQPRGKPDERNVGAIVFLHLGDRRIRVEAPETRDAAADLAAHLAKFLGTDVERPNPKTPVTSP